MKARIKFRKYGVMKFIGHLDVMRYFQKAMRRANIPIAFTQGFSPHMIMSFAQPLGVGITSDGEYLDIELKESISSADAIRQLNEVMVYGIDVVSFVKIADERKASGMTITAAADYEVYLLESAKSSDVTLPVSEELKAKIESFMDQEEITVLKKTKKSEKEVDIKPMIYDLRVEEDHIYMYLATGSEQNLKPDLVMESIFAFAGLLADTPVHYHRKDVYAKNVADVLVPLDHMGYEIK